MATGSLLALLDDITSILDDVSVMTKIAAKKTAGVLGDDLALNAQQVADVNAERELPVVWAVAKGSFVNKLILVPAALTISYFATWLITPLLMLGGTYLCFEGFEKISHKYMHPPKNKDISDTWHEQPLEDQKIDMVSFEKDKIKGAIRTDFVLSAEIIVIALGTVANEVFSKQVIVVSLIAIIMTFGVYGLVAGIVKLDDLGLHLLLKKGSGGFAKMCRKLGEKILAFAPFLMRTLSVIGTAAMFIVGGGILVHGLPFLHHGVERIAESADGLSSALIIQFTNALVGVLAGAIALLVLTLLNKLK
jgi:predicted DNA repair protein MutK